MNDWSDTPIYAQMMAEAEARARAETPIYFQVLEETKQKEKLMEDMQRKIIAFREAMELPVPDKPRTLSPKEANLHINMIRDEFEKEFVPAFLEQNLVEMYDAGIDVLVYVIGALTNAGFDIEPGFNEIMRANMSKMDPETGKAIKAVANDPSGEPEGKVLKAPGYSPPMLVPILNEQHLNGRSDTTVYRTKDTPIKVNGNIIGKCSLIMDHNGVLSMEGEIFDFEDLPQIDGISIYDASGDILGEADFDGDETDQPDILVQEDYVDGAYPIPGNLAHAIKFDKGIQ